MEAFFLVLDENIKKFFNTTALPSPSCVYGNPCYSVCINPKCNKFSMICEDGYQTKEQCYLFHQQCPQIKWSELEKMATHNIYTSNQQFLQFRLTIQKIFVRAIEKIKEEQEKFRIWVKTFGHSLEVMKFIKLVSDQNYDEISGSLISPVINSFFQGLKQSCPASHIIEDDIKQIQTQIESSIENITSLYLRTVKRKVKHQSSMITFATSPSAQRNNEEKQKILTKSQKYMSPQQQMREKNQSQIKNSREGNRYNQRHQRLKGSMLDQNEQTRPKNQVMVKFNSKVYRHIENVKKLFTNAKPISFNLLYRASESRFSIEQFHKSCDNLPNSLVLIQNEFGKIIGGFSALQWKSNKKQWVADKKKQSFMFSLSLNQRYELNLPQFAISCNGQKGTIFGCCDICIVENSDKQKSSAEFPISYNINKKYHRGDQANFAFTGHPKGQYRTKEWEVFQVQFE